jgi:hypothetical protein
MDIPAVQKVIGNSVRANAMHDDAGSVTVGQQLNREKGHDGFFAKIKCRDEENPWRYSFIEVTRVPDLDGTSDINSNTQWKWVEIPEQMGGERSVFYNGVWRLEAEEINKNINVPNECIVWMHPGITAASAYEPLCPYRFIYHVPIWAQITGQETKVTKTYAGAGVWTDKIEFTGNYSWSEIQRFKDTNKDANWYKLKDVDKYARNSDPEIAVQGGILKFPAKEINRSKSIPTGTFVQIYPSITTDWYEECKEPLDMEWLFAFEQPKLRWLYTYTGSQNALDTKTYPLFPYIEGYEYDTPTMDNATPKKPSGKQLSDVLLTVYLPPHSEQGHDVIKGDWVGFMVDPLGQQIAVTDYSIERFRFYNDTYETIPAYAVMQVSGVHTVTEDPEIIPKVIKPVIGAYIKLSGLDSYPQRDYLVNTGAAVESHKIGWFQNKPFVKVLAMDTSTLEAGTYFGPSTGEWHVSRAITGQWSILAAGYCDATSPTLPPYSRILEGTIVRSPIQWGKVNASFSNVFATTSQPVTVRQCDYLGNNTPNSGSFIVYTPVSPRKKTDIAVDDIVGYTQDSNGNYVIVSDIWNNCCPCSLRYTDVGQIVNDYENFWVPKMNELKMMDLKDLKDLTFGCLK